EYLRSHGTPERLEQLAGHNCPPVRALHTGKLLEWPFPRDGPPLRARLGVSGQRRSMIARTSSLVQRVSSRRWLVMLPSG
ncbi:hypothetical protein KQ738_17800, partial [Listeria monocytogenes]|nr:hypothetical protein [Listeria monocytogenes]